VQVALTKIDYDCFWCNEEGNSAEGGPFGMPIANLYSIYRCNIRPCLLHLKKRIVEHHLNVAIRLWFVNKIGTKRARTKAKLDFEDFCRTEIRMMDFELVKGRDIHLTGDQADRFLQSKTIGLKHLDSNSLTLKLWKTMKDLISLLRKKSCKKTDIEKIKTLANNYRQEFEGRYEQQLTPYQHLMVEHAAQFMEEGLQSKIFLYHYSGEAMEHCNNQDQSGYHRKTNKGEGWRVPKRKRTVEEENQKETMRNKYLHTTNNILRKELEIRGLTKSGKKADLVGRLMISWEHEHEREAFIARYLVAYRLNVDNSVLTMTHLFEK
jgi:hypothetical protein